MRAGKKMTPAEWVVDLVRQRAAREAANKVIQMEKERKKKEAAELREIRAKQMVVRPRRAVASIGFAGTRIRGGFGAHPSNTGCYTFRVPELSKEGPKGPLTILDRSNYAVAVCQGGQYLGLFWNR